MKKLTAAFIILILAATLLPAATYAWISFTFPLSDNDFSTGKLTPELQIYYWDEASAQQNKWVRVQAGGGTATVYPNLGVVESITDIPENYGTYLKIKVVDNSGAVYKWALTVTDVVIKPIDGNGNLIEYNGYNNINKINYYASEIGSQQCLTYALGTGEDNADPAQVSFGDYERIIQKPQAIIEGFLPQENWVYLHIRPTAAELQNIIRCIPLNEANRVQFWMTLVGEGSTADR